MAAGARLPSALPAVPGGRSPRLLAHEALAALVSDVPPDEYEEDALRRHLEDMEWLEQAARAHQEVLGAVAPVVPLRMCTVYRNEDRVRAMLADEAPALAAALVELGGKSEWGVKVFSAADDSAAADAADKPASGADYMRRRLQARDVRQAADERRHAACVAIHERLAESAAAALTRPAQRPELTGRREPMLLNGVYLVPDAAREQFLAVVRQLADDYAADGLELQPTGPWPAYNFVTGVAG
jgi:hypothetical protein